jgi:REP-associated tyrosine transposase
MPNPRRIHVPGATYYLFRRTDSRHPIFSGAEDYIRFEELLTPALNACGAKLLGYCWLPEALHLVIEIGDAPVARFMRNLMWRYSRQHSQRPDHPRPWFRERYHAILIQADLYLQPLIKHVHYQSLANGLAAALADYPYSSHHAYLGRPTGPFVCTRRLLRSLGCIGDDRRAYVAATAHAPTESIIGLFERGLPEAPGIVGDPDFVSERQRYIRCPRAVHPTRTLDRLITNVAERHGVSLDELCSRFRRRELVIARAQITWFAILWEIASMKDLARRLQHSPSTLSRAVARYRKCRPELFRPEAIAHVRSYQWPQLQAVG